MTEEKGRPVSDLPTKEQLYNPILNAFRALGRSASPSEVESRVIGDMSLPDNVLEELTPAGWPRLRARLDWSRFDLKNAGFLDSTQRGVWALTNLGQTADEVDPSEVLRISEQVLRDKKQGKQVETDPNSDDSDVEPRGEGGEDSAWRGTLLKMLLSMNPSDFESLCQLMLKESGFTNVSVTPASRDGGIDGNGFLQIQGLISEPVSFQCKRWKPERSVGAPDIQGFRGAIAGKANRGLFITTSNFTRAAREEAARLGGPYIDLIDGNALLTKLAELGLGVGPVTRTEINVDWWESNYKVSL